MWMIRWTNVYNRKGSGSHVKKKKKRSGSSLHTCTSTLHTGATKALLHSNVFSAVAVMHSLQILLVP